MSAENRQFNLINAISVEIASRLSRQKSEEYFPTKSADEMDDYINKRKDDVQRLREIRCELEEIFASPI